MNLAHGGNVFALARSRGWDWQDVLDLSANINPLGPSPHVREAIIEAIGRTVHYPDAEPARLLERLSEMWSVPAHCILAGNGATELLHFAARVWPQPDVTVVTPAFSEFHRAYPNARLARWDAMADWPARGLVILTQPNNPLGQAVDCGALREWLLATHHPVMIDESFLEFTDLPSAMRLVGRRENLLVLRSLTKFHALPGLRIGALAGSPGLMAALRRHREPWQVNTLAEAAALAALSDLPHMRATVEYVRREREFLADGLARSRQVAALPTVANYYLLQVAGSAAALCSRLLESKVIVRNCTGWPGVDGEAVRIAIRTRAENEQFLEALEGIR